MPCKEMRKPIYQENEITFYKILIEKTNQSLKTKTKAKSHRLQATKRHPLQIPSNNKHTDKVENFRLLP